MPNATANPCSQSISAACLSIKYKQSCIVIITVVEFNNTYSKCSIIHQLYTKVLSSFLRRYYTDQVFERNVFMKQHSFDGFNLSLSFSGNLLILFQQYPAKHPLSFLLQK